MAELKYKNIDDESGERIATNAFYTGHKLGTPTQDAAEGADNDPYVTERGAVHCGTILQDAADDSFPEIEAESGETGDNSSGESGETGDNSGGEGGETTGE